MMKWNCAMPNTFALFEEKLWQWDPTPAPIHINLKVVDKQYKPVAERTKPKGCLKTKRQIPKTRQKTKQSFRSIMPSKTFVSTKPSSSSSAAAAASLLESTLSSRRTFARSDQPLTLLPSINDTTNPNDTQQVWHHRTATNSRATPATATTTTTTATTPQTTTKFMAAKPAKVFVPVTTTKRNTGRIVQAATATATATFASSSASQHVMFPTPTNNHEVDSETTAVTTRGSMLSASTERTPRKFIKASGPLEFGSMIRQSSSSAAATASTILPPSDTTPGPCWVKLPLSSLTTTTASSSTARLKDDTDDDRKIKERRWWPCLAFEDLHEAYQMLSSVYDDKSNENIKNMRTLKQQIGVRLLENTTICCDLNSDNMDRRTKLAVMPLVGKFQVPSNIIFLRSDIKNNDVDEDENSGVSSTDIKRFRDLDFVETSRLLCAQNLHCDPDFRGAFEELCRLMNFLKDANTTNNTYGKRKKQHGGHEKNSAFRPTKFRKYDSSPIQNHLERMTERTNVAASRPMAGSSSSWASSKPRSSGVKFKVAKKSAVLQIPPPSRIADVTAAPATATTQGVGTIPRTDDSSKRRSEVLLEKSHHPSSSRTFAPSTTATTTSTRGRNSRFKLNRSNSMMHERMVGTYSSKSGSVSNLKDPPPATVAKTKAATSSTASTTTTHHKRQKNQQGDKQRSKKAARKLWEETGKTIEIASWVTIRKLLEQIGHVFGKNMFCRPFGDPEKYPDAVEGEDYFTSFTEYRAYLCAHGVDYAGAVPWDDGAEEIQTIQSWVRSTVLSTARNDKLTVRLRDLYINRINALRLLKAIGVKWSNGDLKSGYLLPGDKERNLFEEREMWIHLVKYGLPSACRFNAIDQDDLTSLELCISHGDAYDWISEDLEFFRKHAERQFLERQRHATTERKNRELLTDESESPQTSPAADKTALESLTRAPVDTESPHPAGLKSVTRELLKDTPSGEQKSVADTLDRQVDSDNDEGRNDGNSPTQFARESTSNSVARPPNPLSRAEQQTFNQAPSTTVDQSNIPSNADDDSDEEEEKTFFDVSIPGKNVRQKLRNCLSKMKKDHSDKIVHTGKLSSSLSKIRKFLKAVVRSRGRQGGNDTHPILYVCGSPGTGKTMSTRQLCDDVVAAHTAKLEEWEEAPIYRYLNCSQIQSFSKKDAMEKIFDLLNVPKKARLSRPSDEAKGHAKILILDEIDQLCGSSGTENCLATLLEWASDAKNQLCVIGISNSVQDAKSRRLGDLGMNGNRVVFNTYRKEELVKITESKIGFSVFDKRAMEFIAAKVAASSGDARKYLELVCITMERCLEKLPAARQDAELTKPVVTIRDAMMAIRETNVKYKDIIESSPFLDKVTLCTGVHLSRKLGSRPVLLRELMSLTIECGGVEIDAGPEEFKESVERLSDSGLLTLDNGDRRSFSSSLGMGLQNMPVRFDLQVEDVESALEEFIKSQGFFQRLVERVQRIQC